MLLDGEEKIMPILMCEQRGRNAARQMLRIFLSATLLTLVSCTQADKVETVDPQLVSMQNSPKLSRMPSGNIMAAGVEKVCLWNDKKYSDGASVCDSKIRYKCWTNKWVEVGQC